MTKEKNTNTNIERYDFIRQGAKEPEFTSFDYEEIHSGFEDFMIRKFIGNVKGIVLRTKYSYDGTYTYTFTENGDRFVYTIKR